MADFKLPSGRVVETREPNFDEELRIISSGLNDPYEFSYLKLDAIVPGLSREEIGQLPRPDGRALLKEVNRIFTGRPVDKVPPFGRRSRQNSAATRSTRKRTAG
jgi:hypothetical protein